jgi:hypothetical protein
VRIVTGRGLHSVGPPVLPEAIAALLARLAGTVVRKYTKEPGGGAVLVKLRPPPAGRRSPPGVGKALAPELVRVAEEALAELGIKATPALIETEARRIIRERDREGK